MDRHLVAGCRDELPYCAMAHGRNLVMVQLVAFPPSCLTLHQARYMIGYTACIE
jgi:hypothetical protein